VGRAIEPPPSGRLLMTDEQACWKQAAGNNARPTRTSLAAPLHFIGAQVVVFEILQPLADFFVAAYFGYGGYAL
jgi:hypothetical protein